MKYKFDDIAYNITQKRAPQKEDSLKYIGLEHLDSGSLTVNRYGLDVDLKGDKLVMTKGDVLLGKRNAYLRRAAIAPHDGLFSAHGMILRPKENVIDKDFFPFFIASDYFFDEVIRISVGGLSPTVNWRDLKELEFNLPSLSEQKVLADKLWAAYEVKQSYLKMIEATQEMVKSQFIEMFGDPMTNDKQWPDFSCLNEVTQIVLGSTPKSNNPSYWDGDIRWITPAEMTDSSYFIFDTERHITEDGREAANLTILPEGAVLFSTRAPIGKVGIVGKEMCCNQGFKNFICSDKINNIFLYYTLKFKKNYLCALGTGTTFKELSKKTVESLRIIVPPIELQKQFEVYYKQADKSEFELRKSIKAIDAVIKSLINS